MENYRDNAITGKQGGLLQQAVVDLLSRTIEKSLAGFQKTLTDESAFSLGTSSSDL